MEKKTKKENLQIIRTPMHTKIYVTNVKGGATNQDIRFELLNEKMETKEGVCFISDAQIILNSFGAKRLHYLLTEALETYEKENGKIPLNPKKDLWI